MRMMHCGLAAFVKLGVRYSGSLLHCFSGVSNRHPYCMVLVLFFQTELVNMSYLILLGLHLLPKTTVDCNFVKLIQYPADL